jgi:hypothetical protein
VQLRSQPSPETRLPSSHTSLPVRNTVAARRRRAVLVAPVPADQIAVVASLTRADRGDPIAANRSVGNSHHIRLRTRDCRRRMLREPRGCRCRRSLRADRSGRSSSRSRRRRRGCRRRRPRVP